MSSVEFGNASEYGAKDGGWFVGHFVDGISPRNTKEVEIKWGTHFAGEERPGGSVTFGSTVCVLIEGEFVVIVGSEQYHLRRRGDFAAWSGNVSHTWKALSDSTILTVRWPSLQSQQIKPAED